ncbi:hypothetical protein [Acinetobacter nosocomialis]
METKQPEVKEEEDILSLGLGGNVKKILIKAEKYHCLNRTGFVGDFFI